jgi:ubiquinone biosynthesis protein UbiJ
LLAFPEYAATRIGESVASYVRDETTALARGDELRDFAAQVAAVAGRVDALALRLNRVAGDAAVTPLSGTAAEPEPIPR